MCGLQHHIVVAVNGDVGVYVAVTCMHVQGNPNTAFEYALVNGVAFIQDGLELCASEYVLKHGTNLRFPTGAQAVVLQLRKKRVAVVEPLLPCATHIGQHRTRLLHALGQQFR